MNNQLVCCNPAVVFDGVTLKSLDRGVSFAFGATSDKNACAKCRSLLSF
jgi:hypothetical protein